MARLRDPKTGRFIKATQTTNDSSVIEPVPEVEQINVRSDNMTGEPIVLGREGDVDGQTEQIQDIEKPSKKSQFDSENSRAGVIETALVTGSDSIDGIVDTVMEARPNDDPKRVKSQISAILRDIKNERGRWKKYSIVQDENVLRIVVD
jgi:hypothetical protein